MIDVAKVRSKLEARLSELAARAKEIDHDLSEPADDDWSENAVESEGDEVLETMGGMAVDEIQKIKSALSRIDAGRYGICDHCGDQVSEQRLEAVPYATKCINCA